MEREREFDTSTIYPNYWRSLSSNLANSNQQADQLQNQL